MTEAFDEAAIRTWLVEYLITNLESDLELINRGASMHDLGVASRDAVVLTGELSELLGRTVSPVDFWQYPTIDALARFLTGAEPAVEVAATSADRGRSDEPIAVVGMGCRFPGGISGPESFWQFLAEGRSAVGEVPANRWEWFDDGSPESAAVLAATTRWGSYLDDVDAFDAEFFEIVPREAARMDPQQRLLLEVTHEALEHAGIAADSIAETQTGLFVGACTADYSFLSSDLPQVDAWYATATASSIISNRVSYFFDLRGPSVTVDTACSSSLVAVHLACQSLRTGDADLALAAGVNLLLSPASTRSFDQAEALSASGRCHAFDAAADGFVRGEGCGVVVLKRLSDALDAGDRVLAVVRGSAVNQDGRSNGLMAPNPAAQMAVLRSAYAAAAMEPREVGFVETHGTGTLLGDPIEARALGTVLGRGRSADAPLLIGAVKSNLGHLESAAGVAGFIKTVLALHRGVIPANLGYQVPNPHIPFDKLRLKVVAEQTDWPSEDAPRRAGVSSFGFGGTNAHVVLEQAPDIAGAAESGGEQSDSPVSTLVVTGKSAARVASLAGVLADWLDDGGPGADVPLGQVAAALTRARSVHDRFATVCSRDRGGAVAGLRALAAGSSAPGLVGVHEGSCRPGVVFVFSGQGSQWPGMARQLLTDEPVFAAAVAALEPDFVEQVGFSLLQVLREGAAVTGDARVQPVLMGLQLALTQLWRHHGVEPDAVVGHSMGEVTAAVVAGALSPAEGLRVIAIRSRLMSQLAGQGAVALLSLDPEGTAELIGGYPDVEVAGYVSPRHTVVAGPPPEVDAVIAAVTASNRFARRVNMEVASHTALMDPVLAEMRTALGEVACRPPVIPFLSTVIDPARTPVFDADYWVANVRTPVHFSRAVTAAGRDHGTFIEISPHPTMSQAISATLAALADPDGGDRHFDVVGTLERDTDDTVTFRTNVNATYTRYPPRSEHAPDAFVELPATPWQHSRYWFDAPRRGGVDRGAAWAGAPAGVVPAEWFCELTWPAQPAAEVDERSAGRWLVIGSPALGARIGADSTGPAEVTVLRPGELPETRGALVELLDGVTHVLYAPEPTAPIDPVSAHTLFGTARRLALAAVEIPDAPKLFLLTRNAQPITAGDRANPVQAVLWGLGRTLALEHPEIWGAVVDVDETVPDEIAARWVFGESQQSSGEDQIVYRAGVRHVARLRPARAPACRPVTLDPTRSYLVVGATGNIGPHLIGQLADMGAATVVAVSRNPGNRLDDLAAGLAERGITLVTAAADAADEGSLTPLFDRFGTDLPPLGGIYVAAFAGGPVTLADMTDDDVVAMFTPKIDAVSVLHKLSLGHPVDHFVLFSSISGVLGSRWLAHYAATTTYLDALAFARRAAGLPATAINWGLWKSLADAQSDEDSHVTSESGLEPMPDEVAIQAMSVVTSPDAPVRSTVVAADWGFLITAYRTRAALHIVDDLEPTEFADPSTMSARLSEAVRACEPAGRRDLLIAEISALVATAMGLKSTEVLDTSVGFFQFGMDSLMSVTLQRALSENMGQVLPASVVFDYPTVEALADYLATLIPEMIEAVEEDADDYDDLAEEELLRKLSERLS
jgi:phthiocerol/phenolphthiocerol synthesis type-I polyketide synthase B